MNSETIKYSRFEANVFFFDTTIDENSMGVVVSLNRNVREKERERERERELVEQIKNYRMSFYASEFVEKGSAANENRNWIGWSRR